MISYIKKFLEELVLAVFSSSFYSCFVSNFYLEQNGPKSSNRGLFKWEEEAIKNFFPPPPAQILVGAAGGGREMLALSSLGYCVSGFEPILVSANHARSVVPKDNLLAFNIAKYEDLVRRDLKEIEVYAPYDAIILGWGSITHILDTKMQKLILQKVRNLCPCGPILLSWLKAPYTSLKVKLLRKLFSMLRFKTYTDGDSFTFKMGFCHRFTHDEIVDLVKSVGDSIAFYEDEKTYPHAVLLPVEVLHESSLSGS